MGQIISTKANERNKVLSTGSEIFTNTAHPNTESIELLVAHMILLVQYLARAKYMLFFDIRLGLIQTNKREHLFF